jgi:glycosyltransferase involved in cell wall biosynthesis
MCSNEGMITVVISSFKYGHLAAHCIESLLSQTKKPEKIFFVDDGANDCRHLPDLYPQVEFILRNKNLGIVENFQDMLMRVETEYVMFLGADNWLRSDAIELMSKFRTDIVTYDIVVTGELKDEINERLPNTASPYQGDYYWSRKGQHHGSMLYKTALGQQIGYTRSAFIHPQEDWNLWDQMIKGGASIGSLQQGLLYYRRHKENFLKYCNETNRQSLLRQKEDLENKVEYV